MECFMRNLFPRALLALSSAILIFGGVMHGIAFARKAAAALDASGLPTFFSNELKVLWLADSTTLIAVGVAYAVAAVYPRMVPPPAILLFSAIPAATMFLLYGLLGAFYAAHLLGAAILTAVVAALLAIYTGRSAVTRGMSA
jgi:hypothetical protein